jgi:hypothetical protein
MGRRLVDATNACRILRTRRKEPGRRFLVVFFFLVADALPSLVFATDRFAEVEGLCEDVCACKWRAGSSQALTAR